MDYDTFRSITSVAAPTYCSSNGWDRAWRSGKLIVSSFIWKRMKMETPTRSTRNLFIRGSQWRCQIMLNLWQQLNLGQVFVVSHLLCDNNLNTQTQRVSFMSDLHAARPPVPRVQEHFALLPMLEELLQRFLGFRIDLHATAMALLGTLQDTRCKTRC